MFVYLHVRKDKPENWNNLAFRSKFISYKMSTFLGKAYLFLVEGGFLFPETLPIHI